MALTKKDIKLIADIVNANGEYLDIKWEKKFTTIINKLSEHDVRFDTLEAKLNQLIKTEHEDIMVTYKDIENIKLRLKKADI